MKRCVLYSRVSTEKQQCLNQIIEMTEYTKRSDLQIVKTYQDESTSSKKEISKRTQLSQMLSDANLKKFDVLIVSSIDRLARNTKECIEIVNHLNELQIDIIFLRESVDTRTSIGKMIFHVFSSLAEYEREMIRSRIMIGLNRAREQGKKLGRKTKVNDSLCSAVKLLREQNLSIKKISTELKIGIGTTMKILEINQQSLDS
jgi:DNA invertase Pin-like site-specific DNA recombinase